MGARVLVIEDNQTNLDLISYLLQAFGYQVLNALDGATGIDIARREIPDLIVCDIQMPGLDGYEVARHIKGLPATAAIPLVAVTALAMIGDRRKVMEGGFDGYIAKPINPETFVRQVAAFLPAGVNPEPPQRPAPWATAQPKPAARANAGSVILVVDNSSDNIGFARSLLEPSGYRVIWAYDITAGLALARHDPPALILADLHMPDGNGFDLLGAVKSDPKLRSIPFVFLSSTVWLDADTRQAAALAADCFLSRSIEPQTLLDTISGLLAGAGK